MDKLAPTPDELADEWADKQWPCAYDYPDREAGSLGYAAGLAAMSVRLAELEAERDAWKKRAQALERGPMYQRPKYDCGVCTTPTTCAMHGRCMPIIGEPSARAALGAKP